MRKVKVNKVRKRVAGVIILTGKNEKDFVNGQAKDKNNCKGEKRRKELP